MIINFVFPVGDAEMTAFSAVISALPAGKTDPTPHTKKRYSGYDTELVVSGESPFIAISHPRSTLNCDGTC